MRRITLFWLSLWVATIAIAQETAKEDAKATRPESELSNPKLILEKAQTALKNVKSVRYKACYKATGWVTAYVANVEGTAMLGEISQHDIPRFRCEVRLTPHESAQTITLTAGSDGDLYYVIDPKAKVVYADIDDAVLGSHNRDVQRVLVREFVAKDPLAGDLGAEKIELKPAARVGDQPCYQVYVARSETSRVTWFISRNDWLPRRVVRVYTDPTDPDKGEGSTELELSDVVAESTFDAGQFKLNVPNGFTRTDDFAP